MTTENEAVPQESQIPDLSFSDTCDKCQVQAYVRVMIGTSDLLFCGHHFRENEAALAARGYPLRDSRYMLTRK